MRRFWLALGLAAALLAGCASSSPSAPQRQEPTATPASADSPVPGQRWRLILIGTDQRWSSDEPAWFEVESGTGGARLTGSDGCNRLNGEVTFDDGNRIRIENLSSTRMACVNNDEAQRARAILDNAYRYLVDGNRLVLFGRDSRVLGGFQKS